jgi:hypothetical protein
MRIQYLNYNPPIIINNNFTQVNTFYSSFELIENIKSIYRKVSNIFICIEHNDAKKLKNCFLLFKIVYAIGTGVSLIFGSVPFVCLCAFGVLLMHVADKKSEKLLKI